MPDYMMPGVPWGQGCIDWSKVPQLRRSKALEPTGAPNPTAEWEELFDLDKRKKFQRLKLNLRFHHSVHEWGEEAIRPLAELGFRG